MNNVMQLNQMAQENPQQLIRIAQENPQQLIQMVIPQNQILNNPMVRNFISMIYKNDNKGLQTMAENVCRERGTTPQAIANNIKGQFGMK